MPALFPCCARAVSSHQIPGTVQSLDVTDVLSSASYWASYNVPYIKDVFNRSGWPALVAQYGNTLSYDKCPRCAGLC